MKNGQWKDDKHTDRNTVCEHRLYVNRKMATTETRNATVQSRNSAQKATFVE